MPTKRVSACDKSRRLTLQAALLDNEAVKELVNKVMEATPEAITHIKKNLKSLGHIDENDELPPKVTNSDTAKDLQDWKANSAQQRKKSVIVEEFFDNEVPKSANEATVDFLSSFLETLEPVSLSAHALKGSLKKNRGNPAIFFSPGALGVCIREGSRFGLERLQVDCRQ